MKSDSKVMARRVLCVYVQYYVLYGAELSYLHIPFVCIARPISYLESSSLFICVYGVCTAGLNSLPYGYSVWFHALNGCL